METWLTIVGRELILYSLPVLVSLSLIAAIEQRLLKAPSGGLIGVLREPCTWLPWLAAIAFHRAVVVALPDPKCTGVRMAAIRLALHAALALVGLLLYGLSLGWHSSSGLPPLHQLWPKVLMFYNLCMVALHLLPLPGFVTGEWLRIDRFIRFPQGVWLLALLAATPLLDSAFGGLLIFPAYAWIIELIPY